MSCFSGLRSLCRVVGRKGRMGNEDDVLQVVGNAAHLVGKQHIFWFQKPGVLLDEGKRSTFVIDGAWREASFWGAAAWVQNGKDSESAF